VEERKLDSSERKKSIPQVMVHILISPPGHRLVNSVLNLAYVLFCFLN